jgi:hypothetical protein
VSDRVVHSYAVRDRERLQQQLGLIDPEVVVCCGKDVVFPVAREIFDDAADAQEIATVNCAGVSGRCLRGERLWIDFVHPSWRIASRKKFEVLRQLIQLATRAVEGPNE